MVSFWWSECLIGLYRIPFPLVPPRVRIDMCSAMDAVASCNTKHVKDWVMAVPVTADTTVVSLWSYSSVHFIVFLTVHAELLTNTEIRGVW
jgi:hypothetical protein